MNTTIYLMRHSEPSNKARYLKTKDNLQVQNEKYVLSSNGEKKARILSQDEEMQNIDVVIASNYIRAISTAKYISEHNGTDTYVIDDFGERKFGIDSWDELPENFMQKQLEEPNYKIKNGESQNEVAERMYNALIEVLNKYEGKRIAIVSHGTAITFLFMKLGEYKNNELYFNNKKVMDISFKWNAPEVFKLSFKDKTLTDIENIKIDYSSIEKNQKQR